MSRVKSWTAKAAHSMSGHLDRLRETLDRLHGRLREAVAESAKRKRSKRWRNRAVQGAAGGIHSLLTS